MKCDIISLIDKKEKTMFDKGFFGGLFDFNGYGKLDTLEKAADFSVFMNLEGSKKTDEEED